MTAIIRNSVIETVELALEKAGVSWFTIAKVNGVGEWERKFSLCNGPPTHFKIEMHKVFRIRRKSLAESGEV